MTPDYDESFNIMVMDFHEDGDWGYTFDHHALYGEVVFD